MNKICLLMVCEFFVGAVEVKLVSEFALIMVPIYHENGKVTLG